MRGALVEGMNARQAELTARWVEEHECSAFVESFDDGETFCVVFAVPWSRLLPDGSFERGADEVVAASSQECRDALGY